MEIAFNLLLVVFLVFLNGFFVAAEFAIVKVRSTRIESLVVEGNHKAKLAKKLIDNLDAYLSVSQLGITLASLGLGWIGEPAIARLIFPIIGELGLSNEVGHLIAFIIAFSIITALHIVLGELAPKSLAIQRSESVAMWVALPMIIFYKLFYPAVWTLNNFANWILRQFGVQVISDSEAAHTEDEIRILMKESHKQGHIAKPEYMYVDNIFDFSDRTVKNIMVPRMDMVCLYLQDDFKVNMEKIKTEKLTRYPICEVDKDHIIGFLHVKDIIPYLENEYFIDIRSLVRDVMVVPESMPLNKLLNNLQKNKAHFAIVVDEYGGTSGLVTLEDIFEEIVGEIQDEFDEEYPAIYEISKEVYSVDAKTLIATINERFTLNIETFEIDTIGGWIYSTFGRLPQEGEKLTYQQYLFTVEKTEKNRVVRVKISKNEID